MFNDIKSEMKSLKNRVLSLILCVAMLATGMPLTTVFAVNETLYGDVNRSGIVDSDDVADLKKYLAEYDIDINKESADVNVDGAIDMRDLLLLEQYVEGMPVLLGHVVTVSFNTTGSAVEQIRLCKGAAPASVVDKMPTSQKDGYVFAGWKKESGEPFYSEDVLDGDIEVFAKFEELPDEEILAVTSFTLTKQKPDLSFIIVTERTMSDKEVLGLLTFYATDGSSPVELTVLKNSDNEFTVKATDGFEEGLSYSLVLGEGLTFKGKDAVISTANFIIDKEEVYNLSFNDSVIYIQDTEEMTYTLTSANGEEIVDVLESALLSNKESDGVIGYFTYNASMPKIGDVLCIYETVHPSKRDYVKNDYADDAMSFIEVTKIEGKKIYFKSLSEDNAEKAIFMPDTIPFSVSTLPSGKSGSVNLSSYDSSAWLSMSKTGVPKADAGDFVVFYKGSFAELTNDSDIYYGKITNVNGDILSFTVSSAEEIEKSQDMFLENPLSGDEILSEIDKEKLESEIENQALNSGFANAAAEYLLSVAGQTNGFRDMKLSAFRSTENGNEIDGRELKNLGLSWDIGENISVTATIGKSSKYFKDGIALSLRIDAEYTKDVGNDGEMKIELSATFVEEISVDISINAKAKLKWIVVVPVFESLRFGAAVDVKNYSAVSVDLRIYTVAKEDESLWEKLKGISKEYAPYLEKAEELKNKIQEGKETLDKIKGYKEDLEKLWNEIESISNSGVTEESYNGLLETLGELNVTQEMAELLGIVSDEEMDAGVRDLMDRYSEMLETQSDWVTLLEYEILSHDFLYCIMAIGFEIDFVIKANINIALGANLEYVVGKRYSFWIDIIEKTSGSSTIDLLDERFAFQFYVMGALGLKMGVKASVKVGIISTKVGSIGVSAEFGPYIKLYGYFIYEYSKMRPMGTNEWLYDERMMGAMYLEFGLYLEVAFEAQVLDGLISYNPTLCDLEIPLLHAGNRKNYFGFAYEIDKDEVVAVADTDNNSNNGITMVLPDSYRNMDFIDLVTGDQRQEICDYDRFIVTLTNRNFTFDKATGEIIVNVPKDTRYMECELILTWKMGKLEFSSRDISVSIPLVWTDLTDKELNTKYTASVKVGNATDGYTSVWSERLGKGAEFDLPSDSEILELIGYDDYKYSSYTGYKSITSTEGITLVQDAVYYFDVSPREYTLKIEGVTEADGSKHTAEFKAKYGQSFDLSKLYMSGDDMDGVYTDYLKSVYNDGQTFDIDGVIDVTFAKKLLSGKTVTAVYSNAAIEATFSFVGADIDDMTVSFRKGTVPPAAFAPELAKQNISVTEISPVLGIATANIKFTVNVVKAVLPSYTLTYHTNGGSAIKSEEITEGSMLLMPGAPQREGYDFAGWYSDSQLKNAFDFTSALMPGSNLELYAAWKGKQYTLSLDCNEGALADGVSNTFKVTYGSSLGTLPTPVRSGYAFTGWFTERTAGNAISGIVNITENKSVYAHWSEKKTIDASSISYILGQGNVYDRNAHDFAFSCNGVPTDGFEIYYMRQGIDDDYSSKAINAGTYDVKLVHPEDNSYKYFETFIKGAYEIEKAEGKIITPPQVEEQYYASVLAKKMVSDVDYIGDGTLQFAISGCKTDVDLSTFENIFMPAELKETDWVSSNVLYNLLDRISPANGFYLFVRLTEGENYTASEEIVSSERYMWEETPTSLVTGKFGKDDITCKVYVQTSNIKNAGTDSEISLMLYGGYNHVLENSETYKDPFETNQYDKFVYNLSEEELCNQCYGTFPAMLNYSKAGKNPGWHCYSLQLFFFKNGEYVCSSVICVFDHWFGAEEFDFDDLGQKFYIKGLERVISDWSGFSNDNSEVVNLTANSGNYVWEWTTPTITDSKRGVTYNPYTHLNAPELSVSFIGNEEYNKYITSGIKDFSLDSAAIYEAMAEKGQNELVLTYSLEFKAVDGNMSTTDETAKRERTVTFRLPSANGNTKTENTVISYSSADMPLYESAPSVSEDGTFDLTVSLDENTGIWGTKYVINYITSLVELTGYTVGDVFSEDEVIPPEDFSNGRYVFFATRDAFDNTTKTGDLFTLHFRYKDGAARNIPPFSANSSDSMIISAESAVLSPKMTFRTPYIGVIGNTTDIISSDKVTVNPGKSYPILSVKVSYNGGEYTDITDSYKSGYIVTKNGKYTFELTITTGEKVSESLTYTLIDSVKPIISGVADGGKYCNLAYIEVTASDADIDKITVDSQTITPDVDGKFKVYPKATAQEIVVCDKAGNESKATITVLSGHFWNDGVETKAATASSCGQMLYTCTVCNATKTEETAKTKPSIVSGNKGTYKIGDENGLVFKTDALLTDFTGIKINGTAISDSKYTVSEDGGAITLKNEYLSALSPDTYSIIMEFTTGNATGEFTVESAPVTPPETTVIPPETTVVPPETTVVPPETTAIPPETTVTPPETTVIPPETTVVPPETPEMPPETGESGSIGILILLFVLSATFISVTVVYYKKRKI